MMLKNGINMAGLSMILKVEKILTAFSRSDKQILVIADGSYS